MNASRTVLAVLLAAASLPSQRGAAGGDLEELPVREAGFEGMVYHLFKPRGTRPHTLYPLVFALHGNGQDAKRHARRIARVSTADLPVFVVAPQYQKQKKFNGPVYPGAGEVFGKILRTTIAEHPIDGSRVVLQGFSMGSNYSTAWVNALAHQQGQDQDGPFPFREVWLNSTAVAPRKPAPKIPYLLFVGEKETAVIGRINVLENVRRAYKSMFIRGLDAHYIEIPGMGHAVNARCCDIMRERLAAMPDHGAAVPARYIALFPKVQDLCIAGRFDNALAELDAVIAAGSLDRKSKARSLKGKILGYLERLARSTGRKRHPTVADYRELSRLDAILGDYRALSHAIDSGLRGLERNRRLSPELAAWREFTAGQKLASKDWHQSVAAIQSIADGAHQDTSYGRRARSHMRALGKDYPSPFGKKPERDR